MQRSVSPFKVSYSREADEKSIVKNLSQKEGGL